MDIVMGIIALVILAAVVALIVSRVKASRAKKVEESKAAHPATKVARDTSFTVPKATFTRIDSVDGNHHHFTIGTDAPERKPEVDPRDEENERAAIRRNNIRREREFREAESRLRRDQENDEYARRNQFAYKDPNASNDILLGTFVGAMVNESTHDHKDEDSTNKVEPQSSDNTGSSEEYTGTPAYGGSDNSSSDYTGIPSYGGSDDSSSSSSSYSSSSDSSSSYSSSSDSSSSYDSGSSSSGGGDW